MNINELFEFILAQGCGVNLNSFWRSKTYTSLLRKQKTLFKRYPENTDEGAMLRAGHFIGGILLNCHPEDVAVKKSLEEHSSFGHGIEMRALISETGKRIIAAAKKQLPKEVRNFAKEWKSATADEQLVITNKLYHLFMSNTQKDKSIASTKNLFAKIVETYRQREKGNGIESFLPLAYGKWSKENEFPNCQGKTQMLVAFARMIGAPVMLMLPNVLARDILDKYRIEKIDEIENDIEKRGIEFPDSEFMDSITASVLSDDAEKMMGRSFHVCPAIQIRDGRWVIVDSNSLNWGVLNDKWNIGSIYQKLAKYSEVLPGLSIGASEYEHHEEALKTLDERIEDYLRHSRRLQEILDPIEDFIEAAEAFVDSGELDFIHDHFGRKLYPDDTDRMMKVMFASNILFGPTENIFSEICEDPENFLKRKKGSIYTLYHSLAIDEINDHWNHNGYLIHPEAHFAINAEYHISISALNSASIDKKVPGMSLLIAQYSFCQTTLHNAMLSKEQDLAQAAATAISRLPYQHELSKKFINFVKK